MLTRVWLDADIYRPQLIDPEERFVLVYRLGQQPQLLTEADLLPVSNLVASLRLTVAELFGWLRLGGDR